MQADFNLITQIINKDSGNGARRKTRSLSY